MRPHAHHPGPALPGGGAQGLRVVTLWAGRAAKQALLDFPSTALPPTSAVAHFAPLFAPHHRQRSAYARPDAQTAPQVYTLARHPKECIFKQ